MSNLIDFTVDDSIMVKIEAGKTFSLVFYDIPSLDTDYALTLDAGMPSEAIYNVASGNVVLGSNEFTLTLDTNGFEQREHCGFLESPSNVIGTYFKVYFEILVI